MAEKITNFLHYGASPGPIESVNPSVADDFVPSLVLSATDDPSIAPPLLFPLVSNRRTPKAMAYASLDYNQVRQLVAMEEEQEADKKTTQETDSEDDCWERDWGLSNQHCSVDECLAFESREVLVKGLLTAKWGAALLAATLINNPLFQERGAMLIADFLSQYIEKCEMDPFSPAVSSLTDKAAPNQSSKDAVQQKLNPRIFHCLQQASWVFVLLCRSVPQLASTCREALVRKCTFAAMVMHITVELLHDELEFFSRIFFSDQKTSKWMLSFFRLAPKDLLMFMPRLARTEMLTDQLMELPSTGLVSDLGKDMERTIKRVRKALLADAEVAFHEEAWRGRLHGHLRLYCVLMHAGDMQPTDEEINFWLNALGGKRISSMKGMVSQPQNIVTERMLQLGIAFFCLVPGVMSSSTKSLCYCCISFLLRPAVSGLASSNPGAEVAVWLVVQLLLRRYPDIALGYDTQLIPMMMEGVPAMVQCFDFLQELLHKSQQTQQVFAVILAANLVRRYSNHPQSLAVAQQVVAHVKFMRNKVNVTPDYLQEMLEPVAWCSVTFPCLASEVTVLLQSCLQAVGALEQSSRTHDHALHDAAVAAFRFSLGGCSHNICPLLHI